MTIRALGVYIYGGGFYFGMKKAGFDVVAHLEDGPILNTQVLHHNVPELPIRYAPDWGLDEYKDNVDVVFCNPPCAVWSPIGMSQLHGRDSYKTDPRIGCWETCVKVGLATRPKVLLIETVPRGYTIGLDFLRKKALQVQKEGYKVALFLHSIRWMGSAQNRQRLFFIATKGFEWNPLEEPWHPGFTVDEILATVVEKGEPIWPMPPHWVKIHRSMTPNTRKPSFKELTDKDGTKPRAGFMNYRLMGNTHMGAYCGSYNLHPYEPRALTMPEARALCGYPETYAFPDEKSRRACGTVFAQAVMPVAGDYIGRTCQRAIEANVPVKDSKKITVWDWRKTKKEPIEIDLEVQSA